MTSYVMEHHQRSPLGNGLIIAQMAQNFRMPKDFPSLVYLSLVLQAEGIRYGVEHWRRNRARVSGTLIWQLNDCWPWPPGPPSTISAAGRPCTTPRGVLCAAAALGGRRGQDHGRPPDQRPAGAGGRGAALAAGDAGRAILAERRAACARHALADTLAGVYDFSALVTAENQRRVVFVAELWQDGQRAPPGA
jgi:beta-mannosidase